VENIFFTSDEHYGHFNILKFTSRPFISLQDMKEKLINNHNSIVGKNDEVFHLGDMFWKSCSLRECLDIRYALNGKHYFVYGNHDERIASNKVLQDSFVWCKDAYNLQVQGLGNIYLHHYACRVWPGSHRNSFHLYGHSHGNLPEATPQGTADESPLSFDCGVDAQNYFPISLEYVQKKMEVKIANWKPKKFDKEWKKDE
jgi:calcineurin-like phosphoesterase family protein